MVLSDGMIPPERLPLSDRSNVAVPAGAALPLAAAGGSLDETRAVERWREEALDRAGIPFPERVVYVQAQVPR